MKPVKVKIEPYQEVQIRDETMLVHFSILEEVKDNIAEMLFLASIFDFSVNVIKKSRNNIGSIKIEFNKHLKHLNVIFGVYNNKFDEFVIYGSTPSGSIRKSINIVLSSYDEMISMFDEIKQFLE